MAISGRRRGDIILPVTVPQVRGDWARSYSFIPFLLPSASVPSSQQTKGSKTLITLCVSPARTPLEASHPLEQIPESLSQTVRSYIIQPTVFKTSCTGAHSTKFTFRSSPSMRYMHVYTPGFTKQYSPLAIYCALRHFQF